MDTKIINSQNAPAAVGPYCHAVEAGDFVFTSGQIGLDPQTQELKEGVAEQTKQVLANLTAVLKASDLTLDNVIKTTVFLADINDFAESLSRIVIAGNLHHRRDRIADRVAKARGKRHQRGSCCS